MSGASPSLTAGVALLGRLRGVRGVVLTSLDDALPIASSAHVDVDVDALAAIAADIYRRAIVTAKTTNAGAVRRVSLEAEGGRLVAASRGTMLLVVLAEHETNPGLLRLSVQRALEELA